MFGGVARPFSSLIRLIGAAVVGLALAGAATAQEEPLLAGSEGVPVPKRTKMVKPAYPPEAQAKGIRGIVILDLTIDKNGKVVSVEVIRSIPGLDEAAVAAVKQWEYEPVKVGGKLVSVKHTVPITFLMQLPEINRQEGIPELRQGAMPQFPRDAGPGNATAVAEVSINEEGQVVDTELQSGEPPFSTALIVAVKTWVFAGETGRTPMSFRVKAQFLGSDRDKTRVVLDLTGVRTGGPVAVVASPVAVANPAAAPTPAAGSAAPQPALSPEPSPLPTPSASAPAPSVPSLPIDEKPASKPAPAVEILRSTAEPPQAEPNVSAVRDVSLAPGVPELSKGRRPVPPPFARMAGVTGTVQVRFAIDASGAASVVGAEGPDLLRPAAEQAVASWVFRRTATDRLYAIAEITYKDDGAAAAVRLER
jgi:TonB family protein